MSIYQADAQLPTKKVALQGLRVSVVTWNVNAKLETKSNIKDLIFHVEYGDKGPIDDAPDLVVVCLQEVVELTPTNVVIGQRHERVEVWQELVAEAVREENFDMVASTSMVGLWMGIFAVAHQRQFISKVQTGSFARGIGGVLGNKGAVLIRFDLADTSVCFVNAHFAAHRENVSKRNEDFHSILMHNTFQDYLKSVENPLHIATTCSPQVAYLEQQLRELKKKKSVYEGEILTADTKKAHSSITTASESCFKDLSPDDHDIIIWAGDLNYRIVTGIDTLQVYDVIRQGRALLLAPYDQLNQERENGNVFQAFHEGLLTFEPTYKYIPGSDVFDNRKEKKLRCPSWCDRVLWRIGSGLGAACLQECRWEEDDDGEDTAAGAAGGDGDQQTHGSMNAASHIAQLDRQLRRQAFDLKRMTFSRGAIDDHCQEVVELMKYDRCGNKISDHKPVRALLNVKVKNIDWDAYEQDLLVQYKELCQKEPFCNKSAYLLNNGITPLGTSIKSVLLQSALPEKRKINVDLTNYLPGNQCIHFAIEEGSCPVWLKPTVYSGLLRPGQSFTLQLSVDHDLCTSFHMEYQERNKKYHELPLLGKYISTEEYYRKGSRMELTCILIITGTVVDALREEAAQSLPAKLSDIDESGGGGGGGGVSHNSTDPFQATTAATTVTATSIRSASYIVSTSIDPLMIPIVCSLDNALDYDQV